MNVTAEKIAAHNGIDDKKPGSGSAYDGNGADPPQNAGSPKGSPSPARETAYRVLARKYRPQNFSDLIGQEPMVRTLTNAFAMGRIAQAWMLTGVRGVGKTTTARILARALNYHTADTDRPTVRLEEFGEHCKAIMEGRHVDVVEMDAASHTGIDDIREIIEQVRYRPVSARYKVYIIDEVHMLSTQAFNGLLKTLEEPPPHAKFIFATTEIRKVPITVLSRCQRFDLQRVDSALLTAHLQKIAAAEGVEAEAAALAMIARAGEGSVRDCLSILDQAIAHGGDDNSAGAPARPLIAAAAVRAQLGLADKTQIIDLFRLLMRGQAAEALAQLQHLYRFGAEPGVIIQELLDFNHFVTRLRFMPALADDISLAEEERKTGRLFAEKLSLRVLSRNWQMLLKGLSEVESSARPLAAAEMLLIRLCHAADLPNLDEVLKALEQSRQEGQPAPAVLTLPPSSAELSAPAAAGEAAEKPQEEAEQKPAETAAESAKDRPAEPAPALDSGGREQKAAPQTLQQMADLAKATGLRQLAFHLRESLRPALLQAPLPENGRQGIFRFQPLAAAPRDIERQISDFLREATGEIWAVQAVESGGATLKEEAARQKRDLIAQAKNTAEITAILQHFPEAELLDVRPKQQTEE